jgi:hypothetical protein
MKICSYANFFTIFILVTFKNLKNHDYNSFKKSIEYILIGSTMFSRPPLLKISGSATGHVRLPLRLIFISNIFL